MTTPKLEIPCVPDKNNKKISSIFSRFKHQPPSFTKSRQYKFGRILGSGTYGVVKQATYNDSQQVAIKIVPKKILNGNNQILYNELALLNKAKHRNIISLIDWFESKDKFYIVTELATGGEMFDRICQLGHYSEDDAAESIREVVSAVEYLHDKINIVHRDLKPENLLYETPDEHSRLMIADFGIAALLVSDDEVLTSMAGSFGYAAPEVIERTGHSKPCDIWSIGIITYTILCGYSPYKAENIPNFLQEVHEGPPKFHAKYWKDITVEARDFIVRCLQYNPAARPTASQLLSHPWLSKVTPTLKSKHNLIQNIREGFNARRKFKMAIETVRLSNKLKSLGLETDDDEHTEFTINGNDTVGNQQHQIITSPSSSTSSLPNNNTDNSHNQSNTSEDSDKSSKNSSASSLGADLKGKQPRRRSFSPGQGAAAFAEVVAAAQRAKANGTLTDDTKK